MNTFNQRTLSIFLVSLIFVLYGYLGSLALNMKADFDCMKYHIPQAQVIGLKTYCGGVWEGTETYAPLSYIKDKAGDK